VTEAHKGETIDGVAYDSADKTALKALADECDVITEKIKELRASHYKSWMEYNKPFGWEVHDVRYGGMLTRFETTKNRIVSFVTGEIEAIPELTENRLRFDGMPDDAPIGESFLWNVYPQNVTAGLL
jgi:hypothetical protein